MTTKEQSRIQVLNGVMEGKVGVAKAVWADGSERAPWVATTGSIQKGRTCCCGSREQGEKAGNHHVPEDTTEGDGAGRGPICRTQPYPSDRDAGRTRGCPSVPLYREAGPAGRRTAESTSPQSPPGATADGSAILRRGCCCRSMGAATTGFRAEAHI